MLRVDNLSVHLLKRISFSLESGEHLTILGANGSGKTTLARALCGLLPTDAVSYGGKVLHSLSPRERYEILNFLPAKFQIYDEHLSVTDYLALNAPATAGEIESVMEQLGITHLKEAQCARLSSGESVLLMVAGAMIRKARYTIFDEPTANLDAKNKVRLYRLLKHCEAFEHRIVITHDLNLAYRLGAAILFLEEGEARFYGSCGAFFETENLKRCFGDYVIRSGENYMVNYDENR